MEQWTSTGSSSSATAEKPDPWGDGVAAGDPFGDPAGGWSDPATGWGGSRRLRVALVGPQGSGKTCFAASIRQACLHTADWPRRCLPLGETVRLVERGPSACGAEGPDSGHAVRHRYHLEPGADPSLEVELIEVASADFLSVSEPRITTALLDVCYEADALALLSAAAEPQAAGWRLFVERLIEALARPCEVPRRRRWPRWPSRDREPFEVEDMRCLHFSRVLLLVSRADVLGRLVARHLGDDGRGPDDALAWTRRLDPALHLVQLFGWSSLSSLVGALDPEALFAGGVVSSVGIPPDGDAPDGRGSDDLPDRWRPLGVVDALRFLVTGRCTGTVRPLGRRELGSSTVVPWHPSSRPA